MARSGLDGVGRIDPLDLGVQEISRDRLELPPAIENLLNDLGIRRDSASISPIWRPIRSAPAAA
jgi:hypothetical protein